jgi:hypothetical protein
VWSWFDNDLATDEEGREWRTGPAGLVWQTDLADERCDLSGHFWATLRSSRDRGRTVWSWMIIGYENQVLAAGQTGDRSAAKRLVEEWDRWVCGAVAVLDSTDNPPAIAEDCATYQPIWPPDR